VGYVVPVAPDSLEARRMAMAPLSGLGEKMQGSSSTRDTWACRAISVAAHEKTSQIWHGTVRGAKEVGKGSSEERFD
jgi:hypothetical protein